MSSLKTASVLAFERKLSPSDALMYEGNWKNRSDDSTWQSLNLQHKDIRGTISNRLKNAITLDPLKLDAEIQKANLQAVDIAALSFDTDSLKVMFTLRVLGNLSMPTVCNNQMYQKALTEKIGTYLTENNCRELSLRYAENLANGRFLWRNRIGAEEIEIKVTLLDGDKPQEVWIFNAKQFNLREFSASNAQITALAETIQKGLLGDAHVFFKVEAFVRIGKGQEVFPSQELVRDSGNEKYKKSKFLYAVNEVAALHSQKIGNAIRTVDTWYPESAEFGPIAVEPYGSVTSRGAAYRQPKDKMDFFSLLDNWILKDKTPPLEQQHFVVACLIRGGVFGEKEKE
ncbi:MAG: type I-F CRISPR-associated protein Csy3 [Chlamydiales bacterium]|nr:type I-F CRISPR-associated protein Csy3 [Chlamydiales bacterium]